MTLAEALDAIRSRPNGDAVAINVETWLSTLADDERAVAEQEIIRVARLIPLYTPAERMLALAGLRPHPLVGRRVLGKVLPS